MSGLGSVLSIAKDALAVQRYGMEVASHNVANVNTEGYSRQTAVIDPRDPAPHSGLVFGTGAEVSEIIRSFDSFVDARLNERTADLMGMTEKEIYLGVLEGIFNEGAEGNLSKQLSDFWNAWHDLADNPSGLPERYLLHQNGVLLAQGFEGLATDMLQFSNETNQSIEKGVKRINELTSEIATLNRQIVALQGIGNPNDLMDKRNTLLREIAEYVDVKSFESETGNMTVMTNGGFILVDRAYHYELSTYDDEIRWEGSGGSRVVINDTIRGGKIAGWLDIRDTVIPQFKAELDELAGNTLWEVNKIHSLGAGSTLFQPGETLSGTYATLTDLGDLDFSGRVNFTGSFQLWIGDRDGKNLQQVTIDLDFAGGDISAASTMADLRDSINAQIASQRPTLAGAVSAGLSSPGDRLTFTADSSHTFAFSGDSSNILAALGVNTFFTGRDANTMGVNELLDSHHTYIAAARIDPSTGEVAAGDNANALEMANLQYRGLLMKRWTYARGSSPVSEDINGLTLDDYLHTLITSVGIESQSTQMEKEHYEVMVNQLTETRDGISAVSLDEEMAELIKYQHAFTAAAKLITSADEMLKALLDSK
jgi:flagellar hook-associated protein 1 FlgK